MQELFRILVPIAICCVLPIMLVWFVIRKKMNETNQRTHIVLAAIEKNPEMDIEEIMKKISPKPKLLKEKLLTKLLWGCLAILLGFGLIGLGAWLGYVGGGGTDDPMTAVCFGLIALEDLFLAQKPHFDDRDAFMASLTKRLDAVEYIKQHQEATIRRYKTAVVVAFLSGLIVGGLAIVYLLKSPTDVPLFNFDTHNIFVLEWLCVNSRMVAVAAVSLLMTLGITSCVGNIQELMSMRQSL